MRYTLYRFSTLPAEATPARAHYTGQAFPLFAPHCKIPADGGAQIPAICSICLHFLAHVPPTHPHIHAEQFANGRVGCEGVHARASPVRP
jgi:hypothetical protein